MSLEQAILDRLEKRNAQIAQLQSTIQALERAADAEREHARQQLTPLIEENKKLAAQIDEVTNERDKAQRQVMTDRAFIGGCYECAKKHGIKDGEYLDQFIMRIASTLQEVTTERDQAEADAKTAQADAQRLGDECARLAGKVAELEAQKSNASLTTIGYISKADYEAAVTAARENGIHKGESLSGFIWRQCEMLRKTQAANAPLNKVFVVLCKQRGNLNEEIIYRVIDEASDAIKKLTA